MVRLLVWNGFLFRDCTNSDINGVLKLAQKNLITKYVNYKLLTNNNCFICIHSKQVIGFVVYNKEQLKCICVDEKFRNKRIGNFLISYCSKDNHLACYIPNCINKNIQKSLQRNKFKCTGQILAPCKIDSTKINCQCNQTNCSYFIYKK